MTGAPHETESVEQGDGSSAHVVRVRRTVAVVALLNLAYCVVEVLVARHIGSVSLFADAADFLEDTAVNLLVLLALGWPLRSRAMAGRAMAVVILLPAIAAVHEAVQRFRRPVVPDVHQLVITSLGAIVVNALCALSLVRIRRHGGSLGAAAFLAARNDALVNVAIVVMGLVTGWTHSGWPDLVLGLVVVLLNLGAAREVWELAEEEALAARALAGEDLDDD